MAFAYGVFKATYRMPDRHFEVPLGFEGVFNWVSFNLRRKFGERCEASPAELMGLLWAWANDHPVFRQWGEPHNARVRRRVAILETVRYMQQNGRQK